MNLNREKLIQYLEKLDRDIQKLTAQRDSFKQLIQDAGQAGLSWNHVLDEMARNG